MVHFMFTLLVTVSSLLACISHEVIAYEVHYRVCTAEELRKYIEDFCIRHGRDSNSAMELSPYGSVGSLQDERDGALDEQRSPTLVEIMKMSRSTSGRQAGRLVAKRSDSSTADAKECYLDTCCQEGCVIYSDDLMQQCSSLR